MPRLDDESRACERRQREEHAKRLCREDRLHSYAQRIPAPMVSAMAASSISAQVKRARFAFTGVSFSGRGTPLDR